MSINDFVNKELVLFSRQDCVRSIPSMIDGLKPSQRKVLYGCLRRNLTKEIKVVQLSGYISETVLYHHGEQSLNQTIVSMAQDFVGTNNLNFLVPNGQFGTRIMGGRDSASPRYIYTYLQPITKFVFREEDDALLPRQEEEGVQIEPKHFLPILPTVLVNGATGIGTGWSTTICNHNPVEVVDRLIARLNGDASVEPINPWYRGFTGCFKRDPASRGQTFRVYGHCQWVDSATLVIDELPVGRWTQDYKLFLCELLQQGKLISGFRENHTDTEVSFTVSVKEEAAKELLTNEEECMRAFKLVSTLSTSNFFLFNAEGHIQHYKDALEILDDFIAYRLPFYQQRKECLLKSISARKKELQNKAQFVQSVVDGEIQLKNRSMKSVVEELEKRGLQKENGNFGYLLSMPLSQLTVEEKRDLETRKAEMEQKEAELEQKTSKDLWIDDLKEFRKTFLAVGNPDWSHS